MPLLTAALCAGLKVCTIHLPTSPPNGIISLRPRLPPPSPTAGRQAQQDAALAALFEAHPLVCEHLVPSLLGLYSDIEYTERWAAPTCPSEGLCQSGRFLVIWSVGEAVVVGSCRFG